PRSTSRYTTSPDTSSPFSHCHAVPPPPRPLPTRRSSDLRYFFGSSEISESVNFCVMEAIKLCRLATPIIFIASMTQKLTLSDISDESKNYLDKEIGRAVQQECRDR